jgi:uncharacterized protein YeaO (DUF488 family)
LSPLLPLRLLPAGAASYRTGLSPAENLRLRTAHRIKCTLCILTEDLMIKTKSIFDPVEASDGQRILVSRYWPRGLSKARLALAARMPEVAPSVTLLRDWKAGTITWAKYENRYCDEMVLQRDKIKELTKLPKCGTITLLCFEKETNPCCHRHLLKKLIDQI